ncbi:hypothetical protein B484DRAFT_434005 [Ochromonadaceae sp. CCMP2298]|nr:hypothetical protein B484DRAFT_434005 [Ochromonadaceae sp. CCMP2298]
MASRLRGRTLAVLPEGDLQRISSAADIELPSKATGFGLNPFPQNHLPPLSTADRSKRQREKKKKEKAKEPTADVSFGSPQGPRKRLGPLAAPDENVVVASECVGFEAAEDFYDACLTYLWHGTFEFLDGAWRSRSCSGTGVCSGVFRCTACTPYRKNRLRQRDDWASQSKPTSAAPSAPASGPASGPQATAVEDSLPLRLDQAIPWLYEEVLEGVRKFDSAQHAADHPDLLAWLQKKCWVFSKWPALADGFPPVKFRFRDESNEYFVRLCFGIPIEAFTVEYVYTTETTQRHKACSFYSVQSYNVRDKTTKFVCPACSRVQSQQLAHTHQSSPQHEARVVSTSKVHFTAPSPNEKGERFANVSDSLKKLRKPDTARQLFEAISSKNMGAVLRTLLKAALIKMFRSRKPAASEEEAVQIADEKVQNLIDLLGQIPASWYATSQSRLRSTPTRYGGGDFNQLLLGAKNMRGQLLASGTGEGTTRQLYNSARHNLTCMVWDVLTQKFNEEDKSSYTRSSALNRQAANPRSFDLMSVAGATINALLGDVMRILQLTMDDLRTPTDQNRREHALFFEEVIAYFDEWHEAPTATDADTAMKLREKSCISRVTYNLLRVTLAGIVHVTAPREWSTWTTSTTFISASCILAIEMDLTIIVLITPIV